MSDSPSPRRQPGRIYGKQKQGLTMFGLWIETLNAICRINQRIMAERIGVDKSVLSKVTRGQDDLRRDTVLRMIHVYDEIITEKHISLPEYWQQSFFVAWSNDDLLIETMRMHTVFRALLEEKNRRDGMSAQ